MDDKVASASRALGSQVAATFGVIGGLASLFYMAGFVYGVSYFAGVGAPWLAAQSTVSRNIPGAMTSFATIVTILFILVRSRVDKLRSRSKLVGMAVFCTVLSLFPVVESFRKPPLDLHAAFYTYAVIVAAAGAFACFELSISYHLEKSQRARLHGVLSAVAAIGVAFVWIPALEGRAIALADLSDPSSRLPSAIIRTNNLAKPVPVLLITSERVFCLEMQHAGPPRLRPVSWAEIESLSTNDHR